MRYVVLMGNPADGFVVVGPFNTASEAAQYIKTDPEQGNMWVVELYAPAMHLASEMVGE